ncbi:hypothetical protein [Pedobacter steynii]
MTFDKVYQYNFPTTIRFGTGAIKELPAYLQKNGLKRPMIVTDPTIASLPFLKLLSPIYRRITFLSKYLMISTKTL